MTHTQTDKNPILCKIPQNRACRQGCNVVYFLYSLNSCFREKNNLPVLRTLYGKEGLIMSNEEKYLLVEESIAPDIFKKVLEAKKYLATGKARNSSEAVRLADISRSAFYKYKDRVMEYNSNDSGNIVTFYLTMEDIPGVLSSVINHLAEYGANILTINQNIPSDGIAAVTVSIRMTDVTLEEQPLMQRLRDLHGVVQVSKVS